MRATAVDAAGVSMAFGPVRALDGISLRVGSGEVFGLVGPDGAGKTTMMRILAALLTPDAGDVRILGLDVRRSRQAVHDRIGYMSQRFGLYADLTVAENLAFYADLYGVPRRDLASGMESLLGWSGLAPFRRRAAGRLSGGMKQKLGLACALIHTPELLLLDEPTNGVDPAARREFWRLLHRLVAERGLSIVVTTSYLEEAERCHRMAFIHGGRITADGTPSEVSALVPGGVTAFPSRDPFGESEKLASGGIPATVFGSSVHVPGDVPRERIAAVLGRPVEAPRGNASLEDAFVYLSERDRA